MSRWLRKLKPKRRHVYLSSRDCVLHSRGDDIVHIGESVLGSACDHDWQQACALLRHALEHSHPRGGALRIVLGSDLYQLGCIPWREALSSREDRLNYVSHLLRASGKTDWQYEIARSGYGESTPYCAIAASLQQQLYGVAAEAGCRIVSIRPSYFEAWDRLLGRAAAQRKASRDTADVDVLQGFCLVERGRTQLGLRRNGEWSDFFGFDDDDAARGQLAIRRELVCLQPPPVGMALRIATAASVLHDDDALADIGVGIQWLHCDALASHCLVPRELLP